MRLWTLASLISLATNEAASARQLDTTAAELNDTVGIVSATISPPRPNDATPDGPVPCPPSNPLALWSSDLMCQDPYVWACGKSPGDSQTMDPILVRAFREAQASAYAETAGQFRFESATPADYDRYVRANPRKKPEVDRAFVKAVRAFVAKRVKDSRKLDTTVDPLRSDRLSVETSRIKRALSAAVDAHSEMTAAARESMKAAINRMNIVDSLDLFSGATGSPWLRRRASAVCGMDGLNDNAFAPPDSNTLVICPGTLLLMNEQSIAPGPYGHLGSILLTIAHELAHNLSHMPFPEEHAAFEKCVRGQYGEILDGIEPEPGVASQPIDEWSADVWAAETLAQVVSTMPTAADAQKYALVSIRTFCNTPETGHGSNRFRIETLFMKNPKLRQALGCLPAAKESPGCSLAGASPR